VNELDTFTSSTWRQNCVIFVADIWKRITLVSKKVPQKRDILIISEKKTVLHLAAKYYHQNSCLQLGAVSRAKVCTFFETRCSMFWSRKQPCRSDPLAALCKRAIQRPRRKCSRAAECWNTSTRRLPCSVFTLTTTDRVASLASSPPASSVETASIFRASENCRVVVVRPRAHTTKLTVWRCFF